MSDVLILNRDQIQSFVGDEPDSIRVIEQLLETVTNLVSDVETLKQEVSDLETRVETLESP